jgi:hypothetical protein
VSAALRESRVLGCGSGSERRKDSDFYVPYLRAILCTVQISVDLYYTFTCGRERGRKGGGGWREGAACSGPVGRIVR